MPKARQDGENSLHMKTIAIYTYMNEGGPMPAEPHNAAKWKAAGFDFICLVRKKEGLPDFSGSWYLEELPVSWDDARLNAVLPKLNPQSVLEEFYEYSLWLDPGVSITGEGIYRQCKELQERGVVYADLKSHGNVWSYAFRLWKNGLEPFPVIRKALGFLLGKGIGPCSGYHDTSVIFRKHTDEAVLAMDRWWWECLLDRAGGHCEQLMHIFALKDTPSLKWEQMKPDGILIPR